MPLSNFRLASDQSNDLHVVIVADDAKIRAITHVFREAIDEYFGFDITTTTQQQRVAIVERNLSTIEKIITSKFDAHDFREYTESGSAHGNNNKLIVITFQELSGVRLS